MQYLRNKFFRINRVGRDFVIGDLHGRLDLLENSLSEVAFDYSTDRIFSVGDLIDRGSNSIGCISLLDNLWFNSVLGNHEDMMIQSLYGERPVDNWIYNGGGWHLEYSSLQLKPLLDKIVNLPVCITVQTNLGLVGISHAQPPTEDWNDVDTLSEVQVQKTIWSRDWIKIANNPIVKNIKKTYHGHTVIKEVLEKGNVNFIDTGAVFEGGKLTILQIN